MRLIITLEVRVRGQDSLPWNEKEEKKKLAKTCHLYYSLTLDVVKEPFDDAIEYTTTTLHITQTTADALFFSGERFAGCKQGEEEKENRSAFANAKEDLLCHLSST